MTHERGPTVSGEQRRILAVELRDRYEAGASIRQLAAVTGRSYGLVHALLREAGAMLRSRDGNTRQ